MRRRFITDHCLNRKPGFLPSIKPSIHHTHNSWCV